MFTSPPDKQIPNLIYNSKFGALKKELLLAVNFYVD